MTTASKAVLTAILAILGSTAGFSQAPPELKAKLDSKNKQLEPLSTDSRIVSAVKTYNSTPASPDAKGMTNEKWRSLTLFDPFVRLVGKSELSEYLKPKLYDIVIKIFVSGTDGGKVGFDAKTEHWTHKGMPKHEVPMSGAVWIGSVSSMIPPEYK